MRGTAKIALLVLALVSAPFAARPQGSAAGRLDFSDSIRMVDCDPAASVPGFRLKFNVVDAQGAPLPVQFPPPEKLAGSITVMVDNQPITPFFAIGGAGEKQTFQGRTALVLLDISGSMNRKLASGQTRFETAKAAITSFLDGFQDGIDRIAIVPFESHNVETTIRTASFATTKGGALAQIEGIPLPQSHNNTGLYSAVTIGLDVLEKELKDNPGANGISPEVMVMLMTDGKNEVFKGDDSGLLDGPQGLDQAAAKVKTSGIQVIGVGFGDRVEIDETALRQISTRYYMASDAETLSRIFSVARTLLSSRIQATFASPWPDRASLAGKTLHVSVQLKLPNGQVLASDPKIWATPEMGLPVYEGHCDVAEMKALYTRVTPTGTAWISVLRPVLVFVGMGALILVLWFWIPRLIWADQYIGVVPTKRWGGPAVQKSAGPSPPGFEAKKPGHQAPRAPSDATVVAPRMDFTKTRLGPLPPGPPRPRR